MRGLMSTRLRATPKMPANEKKNRILLGRKDRMDSSDNPSPAPRRASAMDHAQTFSGTAQVVQQRPLSGKLEHASLVLRAQRPSICTALPGSGQHVASVAREPHNTGDPCSLPMVITQAQGALAPLFKDGDAATAKGSPKPCSGSRGRRREHVKERKALACSKGAKAPEGNPSCLVESINVCDEREKASDSTSPASTTSEETRRFGSQRKDVADTAFGSALHLQQAARSSTSATPPASDCSSDVSPSFSPGTTQEAAVDTERPFESVVEAPKNCLPDTGGGLTHIEESLTKSKVGYGKGSTPTDTLTRASGAATREMDSNAVASVASSWSCALNRTGTEKRVLVTQDAWQTAIKTRLEKLTSARRASLDIDLCHQLSSTQAAVVYNTPMADRARALTPSAGLSTVCGKSSFSPALSHAQHDPSSAPPHSGPSATSPLPSMHADKRLVHPPASCRNSSRDVEGSTDKGMPATASEWPLPRPQQMRAEPVTAHGTGIRRDTGFVKQQENGTPLPKGAQCAEQPVENIGRGPASSTDDQHLSSCSAPPQTATDIPCVAADHDTYYTALNMPTTAPRSCAEVEGMQLLEAKLAYLHSNPVQQQQRHGQYGQQPCITAKFTQGAVGVIESPRGHKEKNRGADTHAQPYSMLKEGGEEATAKPNNRYPGTTMPPLLASPASLSGTAFSATGGREGLALMVSIPYGERAEPVWAGSASRVQGSGAGPVEAPAGPFHQLPPPSSYGCSSNPGQERISEEKTPLAPNVRPSVSLPILQDKAKQQAWREAATALFGQLTSAGPQRPSSYSWARSPLTSLWPAPASPSTDSRPFCNSSGVSGGDAMTPTSSEAMKKNCASIGQEKQLDPQQLEYYMPAKQLVRQEHPQEKSRPLEERDGIGEHHPSDATATNDVVIDVPRSVSGSNSGVLWSTSVPPVSLLLTLPLNLPYGKILKFGSPGVLPQTSAVLPPPPPAGQQVSSGCDGQRPLCGLGDAKTSLMPRTLGAKKSYYCFSPSLHAGAHTLFSHAGGICDTFAASLHLELAILYVPPPLLATVASIFQALAPRLPRLEAPLRLECGGLEERNAPGRFGGKVLTVSCAVGEEQERYKFQQMQEFLTLFQSKVEMLLREFTLQQQALLGRKYSSNCRQGQGQSGVSATGKRHNIWRYTMSCMPTSLAGKRALGPSPSLAQEMGGVKSGNMGADVENTATRGPAGVYGTTRDPPATSTASSSGGGGAGGGFLDLTIRAFEAKVLDKAVKEYARKLVVKDVCVSEIRLVTTRGIEDKTCEIDPRFPQYSIGTRPIVLGPDGQLCRHSLVDVHSLPDVWEVRLRPGNTRDEQKRLVERCVLACIENKPVHIQNETLKHAVDAGVIIWVNGKMALLPPPPPPTTETAQQQDMREKQHPIPYRGTQAERYADVPENGTHKQQVLFSREKPRSKHFGLLDSRGSTRPSTPARDAQERVWGPAASCSSRQCVSQACLPSPGEAFLEELLHLSKEFSSGCSLHPAKTDDVAWELDETGERESVGATTAPEKHHQPMKLLKPPDLSALAHSLFPATREGDGDCSNYTQVEAVLAPRRESLGKRIEGDNMQYHGQVQKQVGGDTNYIDSLVAAIGAIHPDLVSDKAAAWRTACGPPPALGKSAPQEDNATHSALLQAQQLLEALVAGWTQQPQQATAKASVRMHQEMHNRGEAEGKRVLCTSIHSASCDSAVQRLEEVLGCPPQMQHDVSRDRLGTGTQDSLISAETSLLLEQLLSLPAASCKREVTTESRNRKQLRKQQWGADVADHMQLTCRRQLDDNSTAVAGKPSAAAASVSEALAARSPSCLIDLTKLLDSADPAHALTTSTLSSLASSTHGRDLLQGQAEQEETASRSARAAMATCNAHSRTVVNSSESTAFFNGVRFDVGEEAKASEGSRDAPEGARSCGHSLMSSTRLPRAEVPSGKTAYQEIENGAILHAKNVAEAESNWKRNPGDASPAPSVVRAITDLNPLPEELSHRQQLLEISCAAAGELAEANAFAEQSPDAALSQHMRSRAKQQKEEENRDSHQRRLPQHFLQSAPETAPEQREDGQWTARQELLDRHALQLLRGGPNVPSGNIFLQGFLPEDLSLQRNVSRSSCREYVPAREGDDTCNLLLQCVTDQELSQQQAKTTDSFLGLHVGGIKQQYNYSQVQY